MSAAIGAVHAGVTENQVAVEAYAAMVGGGSGFLAADPIVTSGPRSGIAHTTFGGRRLTPGDTVLIELGACRDRYFGALLRTVSIGTASPEVAKCGVAVHDALLATIDAIRPGVTGADVHASCVDALAGHGVEKYFRKRVGYSVGLAFAPDWGEGHIISLGPGEEQLLEPGMVFHVVPAVRVSREFCVGLSETVLVTDDGVEVLTSFHDYLVETVW